MNIMITTFKGKALLNAAQDGHKPMKMQSEKEKKMKTIKFTRKMSILEIKLICFYHNLSIKKVIEQLKQQKVVKYD